MTKKDTSAWQPGAVNEQLSVHRFVKTDMVLVGVVWVRSEKPNAQSQRLSHNILLFLP